MTRVRDVRWSDIETAARTRDPQLAELTIDYMERGDPPEDRPEDADEGDAVAPLPDGTWTLRRLRTQLTSTALASQTPAERRATRRASWDALMAAPHPPPRLGLGALLVEIYEAGDEPGRAALFKILAEAKLGWGLWQGLKRIYKLAEARHDAGMFGLLAWRLDTANAGSMKPGEITRGTLVYMQRRAWRFLRQLGAAVPEAYPQFVVEVLRHYQPNTRFHAAWVASQVWGHQQLIGMGQGGLAGPQNKPADWAYPDAWKPSPDPLLRLLEHADADAVSQFCVLGLTELHPDALRNVEPAWLCRLGTKPLASVHTFITKLLTENPQFHPSKLAAIGLHDLVVDLCRSPSADARQYALTYVRAHAPSLEVSFLVGLATGPHPDASTFAVERLTKLSGSELGLPALVRLIAARATHELGKTKIQENFTVADLSCAAYISLMVAGRDAERFTDAWYAAAKTAAPASFLIALLKDPGVRRYRRRLYVERLSKRSAREIGIEWIHAALLDPIDTDAVSGWVRNGKLSGDEVDMAWWKAAVRRPALRPTALELLGNAKWVAPERLGADWLLAMLRQADPALRTFARRQLLEHLPPTEVGAGAVHGPWTLLAGSDQPEAVREFAATYLRVHHPQLGLEHPERKDLGIDSQLTHAAYDSATVLPLTDDPRADVRALASELADIEVARWGDATVPYRLAANRYPEPRGVGGAMLLRLDSPDVAPEHALPVSWLAVDAVFALAESPVKATREVALTLVRRHYDALGGAQRLAWLMESPDREVRLFAVRLLWEKHRPQSPRAGQPQPDAESKAARRFDAPEALRKFLGTVLYGLPPGRMERRVHQGVPDRALPASVAKQRLVSVLRDFAVEDGAFARVLSPLLETFVHSVARGERDACISALATIREAHPAMDFALAAASVEVRPPRRPRFGSTP